jgi:SAM-dependent methyltransferase
MYMMKPLKVYSLHNVYKVSSYFNRFIENFFVGNLISEDWKSEIAKLSKHNHVLEVGAGHGRLTRLIARSGAKVTAVEPNRIFLKSLRKTFPSKKFPRIQIVNAFFPKIKQEKYAVIVLHQNVFLELINTMGVIKTIKTLRRFLSKDGMLLFDYVSPFRPRMNHETKIYEGYVRGIGHVRYSYFVFPSGAEGRYIANMHFFVLKRSRTIHDEHFILCFNLPPFIDVKLALKRAGAKIQYKPIGGFSFFPGRLILAKVSFER